MSLLRLRIYMFLVRRQGIEPRLRAPKAPVLPLDDLRIYSFISHSFDTKTVFVNKKQKFARNNHFNNYF